MRRLAMVLLIGWSATGGLAARQAPIAAGPGDLLTNIRPLFADGRHAAASAWTPDGLELVLELEDEPGNPFPQIVRFDPGRGTTARISTGVGTTAGAAIDPDTGDVLFASTHHDPRAASLQAAALARRAAGDDPAAAGNADPEMELYARSPTTGTVRRLTNRRGFDGEASYSPDGQWIVFTSTRQAYDGPLTTAEQARLATEPRAFTDIYIMAADPDGEGPRRLTFTPGEDARPTFTPDGQRIVWQRADGADRSDIYAMALDGTGVTRLTDLGARSRAPRVHPSGRYVLFAATAASGEVGLYMVDTEGRKAAVRIAGGAGLDDRPIPSPDGTQLAWTSNRDGGARGGQVVLARWNHQAALDALRRAPARPVRRN